MREARLIAPIGHANASLNVRRQLLAAFGGYTSTMGAGAWQNASGKLFVDQIEIFDVGMEDTAENARRLTDIARSFCAAAEQEAVYVRLPGGEVIFIEPDNIAAKNAA